MAWNYAGSEGWAPCAGHICGLARSSVRPPSPRHLCPNQGLNSCVSETTVPEGRGASGDGAHPVVSQSGPGGDEATGARSGTGAAGGEGDPGAGPRERRAGGPTGSGESGTVRPGRRPAACARPAEPGGGDNNGAGPAGRPGKAKFSR